MLTVYGVSASPFVRKVLVVLAEKGVPYEVEPIFPINVSEDYKKISPLGKIPALRDGDKTLCDSTIICAYLERKHPEPAMYPADPYDYARSLWFEEYADTALVNVVGPKIFFQRVVGPRFMGQTTDEEMVQKAVNEELPPLLDYLEGQLDGREAIAGSRFSVGDVSLGSQFVNLRYAGVDVDAGRWPKLRRYVDAVHARPSFRSAMEEDRKAFGFGA
jgi:glutathione S-transferase